MSAKKQTEMQQVINILRPHMCSGGLKILNSYAKLSIREAWNKCTASNHLLAFKLISADTKNKKSKKEFTKVIKETFKEIDAKIKADIKALPRWVLDDVPRRYGARDVFSPHHMIEEDILAGLEADDLESCFHICEELESLDVHTIIKKHIKAPTLQDFLDITRPKSEQKLAIDDWKKLTNEKMFKLLVQHKLYDSSGKRMFK